MDIGVIDTSATLGRSWLHVISPKTKLVAFVLVLGAVVVSFNMLVLLAILLALGAAVLSANLNAKLALGLAAYPAIFAAVFAFASAPDFAMAVTIVLKAVTSALAAVIVVLTTPYPQVFAPVQHVVPSVVGDSLLMTYRASFLMLEKFSDLLRAVRLRSGISARRIVQGARATARALGSLLLYSIDLAQRDYDIMRVRGYEGRLRTRLPESARPATDVVLVAGAAATLAVSVLWRVSWQALNPYSWLPLVPASFVLASAFLFRFRRRST